MVITSHSLVGSIGVGVNVVVVVVHIETEKSLKTEPSVIVYSPKGQSHGASKVANGVGVVQHRVVEMLVKSGCVEYIIEGNSPNGQSESDGRVVPINSS
jgi:hypothetical protein